MATSLHTSVSAAGQSVTVFALTYAVAAPLIASRASRWPTKPFLLVGLTVFTLGNALTALAPTLSLLMLSRIIAAVGAAAFTPVALGAAAALVPAESRGRALAIVMSGLNGSLAIGVPLGVAVARISTWRSAVVVVAVLGILAIIVILAGVCFLPPSPTTSVVAVGTMIRSGPVLSVLVVTILSVAAGISAYTYLASILKITVGATGLLFLALLIVYGIGAFVGSLGAGRLTDRFGSSRTLVVAVGVLIVVLLLAPSIHLFPFAVMLMLLWGAAFVASTPPQQHRLVALVPRDATVAVSLNSSAIYFGQAIGAATGGIALSSGLRSQDLPYLAAALAAVALIVHLATGTRHPMKRTRHET